MINLLNLWQRKFKIIVCLAVVLSLGISVEQVRAASKAAIIKERTWLDVPYAAVSPKQKMDILLPPTGDGPFPVIIGLHDRGGDKNSAEMAGQMAALAKGYAVVRVNYREPDEARFPAELADAKAAVRFIRANAKKYHLETSRIAAWGAGFGGRTAAFLGLTVDHPELDDLSLGNPGESSRVNAVVAWFPVLDETRIKTDLSAQGLKSPLAYDSARYGEKIYGASVQKIPELIALTDPTRYVSPSAVPFIIMHGTNDNVTPIAQSENLAEKLRHNIGSSRVKFVPTEGAGHRVEDFTQPEQLEPIFTFLHKHLKIKILREQQAKAKKKAQKVQ